MERFFNVFFHRTVIKARICILLNSIEDFSFQQQLDRYLPAERFDVTIAERFPDDPLTYQLIIPWSYRKIIKQAEQAGNVVVMHSSNLPEGRGWAPIYYAFNEQKTEYVISGIFAANEVDTGNVIVRARFPISPGYTAPFIRVVDEELSLLLIAKIFEQWPEGNPVGAKQSGMGTFRARRSPKDNEIDIKNQFEKLIPHLRGVEFKSPAFFIYNDVKYFIEIRPESAPQKPTQVEIEYPALNKVEIWRGWA
jgi:methionyl-tRNA formyltransferase